MRLVDCCMAVLHVSRQLQGGVMHLHHEVLDEHSIYGGGGGGN